MNPPWPGEEMEGPDRGLVYDLIMLKPQQIISMGITINPLRSTDEKAK